MAGVAERMAEEGQKSIRQCSLDLEFVSKSFLEHSHMGLLSSCRTQNQKPTRGCNHRLILEVRRLHSVQNKHTHACARTHTHATAFICASSLVCLLPSVWCLYQVRSHTCGGAWKRLSNSHLDPFRPEIGEHVGWISGTALAYVSSIQFENKEGGLHTQLHVRNKDDQLQASKGQGDQVQGRQLAHSAPCVGQGLANCGQAGDTEARDKNCIGGGQGRPAAGTRGIRGSQLHKGRFPGAVNFMPWPYYNAKDVYVLMCRATETCVINKQGEGTRIQQRAVG
eukprot:1159304-Pelagomonas_calceolata.AAC.3